MFSTKKEDKKRTPKKPSKKTEKEEAPAEETEEQVSETAVEDLSFLLNLGNNMNESAPKLRVTGIYGDINEERCSETLYSMLLLQKSGVRLEPLDQEDPESDLVEVNEPFDFFVSSHGGSAVEMFSLYDIMRQIRETMPIHTIGIGKVMSAGTLLLAAGTKGERKIGKFCRVMIHGVISGQHGHLADIENEIRYNKRSSKKLGWEPSWLGQNEFDNHLIDAIIQFQINHDLKPDGLVGTNTYRRLRLKNELSQNSLEGTNNLTVNEKLRPIGWHKVKKDFLPSSCYRRSRIERKPHVIVTHWDVCTSAASCKRVLEKRNISTHFVIDNDGTIVQLVDTNNIAWHAKGANNHSIGIDISNAYYPKYASAYRKQGLAPRPILNDSVVHGRKLRSHFGYYPAQLQAYSALITFLCKEYDIPFDYPKNDDGTLCTGVYNPAVKNKFRGVINHYNLTRNKIDTAGLKLDEIIDNIKKMES
jgi:ATP-dependent protease ClpP protease subunit